MSNYSDALAYSAGYCAASEHCASEVLDKLKRFELTTEEQRTLIQKLQSEGYLNEERFVHAFVNDKFRFGKWGRQKIRFALRQKGISNDLVESGLMQIQESDYHQVLIDLLRQKKRTTKAATTYELRGKLLRFAASRGFDLDASIACLRKIGLDDDED
jgi:regulatory protein